MSGDPDMTLTDNYLQLESWCIVGNMLASHFLTGSYFYITYRNQCLVHLAMSVRDVFCAMKYFWEYILTSRGLQLLLVVTACPQL